MNNQEPIITLNKIYKEFENQESKTSVLNGIDLTINKNEFICVVGPSGCGKSTLLKIIAGYLMPTSGVCKMHDKLIIEPDSSRGVVFQSPTLYPWLTVKENIEYGLKIKKMDKEKRNEKSKNLMEKIQLVNFSNAHTFELSGGMKQRVSLARTIINEPELILMDEPFSALDAITRTTMQDLIRQLWRESKQTIFMITHDIEEALKLGTRVIVMSKESGQILKDKEVNYTTEILKNKTFLIEGNTEFNHDKFELFQLIS